MNKIKKYFKNLNIIIDDSHKEDVRKEIYKFIKFPEEKKKINFLNIFKYSLAPIAAGVAVLLFIFIIGKDLFIKKDKALYSKKNNENKIEAFEKDKKAVEESKNADIDKGLSDEKADSIVTEKDNSVVIEKQKSIMKGKIEDKKEDPNIEKKSISDDEFNEGYTMNMAFYSNVDVKPDVYKTDEDESKEVYGNKKAKEYRAEKLKNEDMLSESRRKESEESTIDILRDQDDKEQYVSTENYNQIMIIPNTKKDSYEYLNHQIMNNLPLEPKKVKDEEIINYFCLDSKNDIAKDNINIEGTNIEEEYFLIIYFNLDQKIKKLNLEITFNPPVIYYMLAGYPNTTNYLYTKKIDYKIDLNNNAFILAKLKIDKNLIDDEELGEVKISYTDNNNKTSQITNKFYFNNFINIENTNLVLKKAILAYMIAQESKNQEYTINDIIDYKKNYIDKSYLSKDLELFLTKYIHSR